MQDPKAEINLSRADASGMENAPSAAATTEKKLSDEDIQRFTSRSEALRMARTCQLVVKTIASKFDLYKATDDDHSWERFLLSLSDLSANRQLKIERDIPDVAPEVRGEGTFRYDPATGNKITDPAAIAAFDATFNPIEYLPGQTRFTVNTSTTLLPVDGKINLFGASVSEYAVGLGFSLRHVHLNGEKTIFTEDARTDYVWWKVPEFKGMAKQSVSVNALIQHCQLDRRIDATRELNELYIGVNILSTCCIILQPGTAASYDDDQSDHYFLSRFDAIFRKQAILHQFSRHLPIIIVDRNHGISEYSLEAQNKDLDSFLERHKDKGNKLVADLLKINQSVPQLEMDFTGTGKVNGLIESLYKKIKELDAIQYILLDIEYRRDNVDESETAGRLAFLRQQIGTKIDEIKNLKDTIQGASLDRCQQANYQNVLREEQRFESQFEDYVKNWREITLPLTYGESRPAIIDRIITQIGKPGINKEYIANCLLVFIQNKIINRMQVTKNHLGGNIIVQVDTRKLFVDEFTKMILDLIEASKCAHHFRRFQDALIDVQGIIQAKYLQVSSNVGFFKEIPEGMRQFYIELNEALFKKIAVNNIFREDADRYYLRQVVRTHAASAAVTPKSINLSHDEDHQLTAFISRP